MKYQKTTELLSKKNTHGLTMVELLISIFILSLIVVPIYEFVKQSALSWEIGENRTEVVQNARIATEDISAQLRSALKLYIITAQEVRFWDKDLNDDDIADPGEIVTFSWSGIAGDDLTRKLDSETTATPLASYVENLNLEYRDISGIQTINPDDVRVIIVNLTVSKTIKDNVYSTTMRTSAFLRNL